MERLSGLDSAFLSFETPAMHLHVAIAAVIDPDTMAGEYSFEQLKDFVAGRLLAAAAFRRRVVEVPFRLNHPIWVEDPYLDLDYHVRRHALPAPARPELTELVGAIVGVPSTGPGRCGRSTWWRASTTATWPWSARSTTPRSTGCPAPSCSSTSSTSRRRPGEPRPPSCPPPSASSDAELVGTPCCPRSGARSRCRRWWAARCGPPPTSSTATATRRWWAPCRCGRPGPVGAPSRRTGPWPSPACG